MDVIMSVRFTRKQPDYEIVPELHDSSGETADAHLVESAIKKI